VGTAIIMKKEKVWAEYFEQKLYRKQGP
jgi:hypothetical protein